MMKLNHPRVMYLIGVQCPKFDLAFHGERRPSGVSEEEGEQRDHQRVDGLFPSNSQCDEVHSADGTGAP